MEKYPKKKKGTYDLGDPLPEMPIYINISFSRTVSCAELRRLGRDFSLEPVIDYWLGNSRIVYQIENSVHIQA